MDVRCTVEGDFCRPQGAVKLTFLCFERRFNDGAIWKLNHACHAPHGRSFHFMAPGIDLQSVMEYGPFCPSNRRSVRCSRNGFQLNVSPEISSLHVGRYSMGNVASPRFCHRSTKGFCIKAIVQGIEGVDCNAVFELSLNPFSAIQCPFCGKQIFHPPIEVPGKPVTVVFVFQNSAIQWAVGRICPLVWVLVSPLPKPLNSERVVYVIGQVH